MSAQTIMAYRFGTRIGGESRVSDRWLEVKDPATGAVVGRVALADERDCIDAVEAAARAMVDLEKLGPRGRSELLRRIYQAISDKRDEIAEIISRESGKVRAEALAEVDYGADYFRWFAEEAVRVGGEYRVAPSGTNHIMTTSRPIGVAVLVTPWNFPLAAAARKIAAALAAGCGVVLKPAPDTPLTSYAIADLAAAVGAPAGAVNVVMPDPPAAAVESMLEHEAVRKLSFTGSTEVGQRLMAVASRQVLSISLELGGNGPFLILDDADMDVAVEAAVVAKMRNGGATCVAANRFLVHESMANEFTGRLVERLSALRVGPAAEPGSQVGPMINERECQKVERLVNEAVERGANLLLGGSRTAPDSLFYRPTVLRVDAADPILDVEVFGPVAVVASYGDTETMVKAANATSRGLVAYVMSADLHKAVRIAHRLEAGMVGINRGMVSDAGAPFGGVKTSGLGREGGREGIEAYLETQYLAVPR